MEIITGYTGENHVTSADDASLYRGILGQDDYVLEVGSKFAATVIDNNTVRVMDGDLVIQGHQARIRANDYNEVTIDNGTPGQKRNDLIVARYQKNTITGIESITLEVVKGTPGATATDPEIVQEDLKIGGTQRDFPLYRVSLNGLVLESVTSLFTTIPNLKVLKTHMAEKASDSVHGATTDKIANTLVARDTNGRIRVETMSHNVTNQPLVVTEYMNSPYSSGNSVTSETIIRSGQGLWLLMVSSGVGSTVSHIGCYLVKMQYTGKIIKPIVDVPQLEVTLDDTGLDVGYAKVVITNVSGTRGIDAALIKVGV